ncbi:glycosyltransferase family 2 protein [Pseudoxanthomonas sp. Root630]|uniref:glycosyltransferase family 2 protein n=1 Tax=Pseudoxanthomonas sp. Root630 TaxID=1736574 RepID=UPI000702DAA0|nr:glycosyltransferase family 2 protein [Pseudoxanthomonas sp. Root630]KRA46639.1 glycosyl transferase [Pseudoxanthomonas sp. Root630]
MQPVLNPRYSLIIPVYRNAENIDELVPACRALHEALDSRLEVIFVVDGSPDDSHARLKARLPSSGLRAQLISLSRNFGSFAAIREGMLHARGEFAAVMAADLQEPPELVLDFFSRLEKGEGDIAFGVREARNDPMMSKVFSAMFWRIYRSFVQRDVPVGGVDVFAVNRAFLDRVTGFSEANSSLLALLFWMGGRRIFVPYVRRERVHGKSAWTFRKKFTYLLDSVFAFTDAPIRLLLASGILGMVLAITLGIAVLLARLLGEVDVPGYTGTMLTVLFFGGLNALGLGLVGNYAWRAYENTKHRPLSIPMMLDRFGEPSPHPKEQK